MDKKTLIRILNSVNNTSTEKIWNLREKALSTKGIIKLIYILRYYRKLDHLASEIPLSSSFESRPTFPHGIKGIFVSSGAKVGHDCVIFHQVTIGSNTIKDSKGYGSPQIGDNVYIGAGAKIVGGVKIGNNVRVGANCVVVCDIPDNSTVVMEKPRIIEHQDCHLDNSFKKYVEE